MSVKQTKQFAQRFGDMVNTPDMNIINEIFAPHFVAHVPLMPHLNRSAFQAFFEGLYTAFPDFIMEVNASVITRDQLVLRVTCYGTHQGGFLGIAATGCQIVMPGICIFQVKDNLVVENWMELDIFGVIRQISEVRSTGPLWSLN